MGRNKQANNVNFRIRFLVNLAAATTFLAGLLIIAGVLFAQSRILRDRILNSDAHINLLIGLTLVYLATLLRRGKRTALAVALGLYSYIIIRNLKHFIIDSPANMHAALLATLNIAIPGLILLGLVLSRHYFTVRSGLRDFHLAVRSALLVLLVAFLYGLVGFQLLDQHDFHQEISIGAGAHYTIDQFGLTTNKQLVAYTRKARLFTGSLATISIGSLFYVGLAFFAPIRFRLSHPRHDRENLEKLLKKYPASSEDFFKLWPHDKAYFFGPNGETCLAYKVVHGVALAVGDPAGRQEEFDILMTEFLSYCHVNDWDPAFIHTENKYADLYKRFGFEIQKIGEEAVVDIANFQGLAQKSKYFRNIKNKFQRQGYSCQLLTPPHGKEFSETFKKISDDWLSLPGRAERTFMMGYFNEDYIQQCQVMVARDETGKVQAFINQVPSFDEQEANFDFVRYYRDSPGNTADFLIMNYIQYLEEQGFKRLNMGLSPLAGLEKISKDQTTAIDSALKFIYLAGGRFYSFSGLKRFKDKYEPTWQSRSIAYKGGIRGFSKAVNALMRAMKV